MDIDAYWLTSPEGITCGGWGLYLNLEDTAKLGSLFVSGGMWHKKRLVSEKWLKECTKKQIDTDMPGMCTGYGYQFWIGKHSTFLAFGSAGQLAVCHPQSGTVIIARSGCTDIQLMYLERALINFFEEPPASALPKNASAQSELSSLVSNLEKPLPKGECPKDMSVSLGDASLIVSGNTLTFSFGKDAVKAGYGHYIVNNGIASAFAACKDGIYIKKYDLSSCFEEDIYLMLNQEELVCRVIKNTVLGEMPAEYTFSFKE